MNRHDWGYMKAWIVWAAGRVGYRVRPFDMLADRRRWFWQPRERCRWGR